MMNDDLIAEARRTARLGTPDFTNSALLLDLADALEARDKEITDLKARFKTIVKASGVQMRRAEAAEIEVTSLRKQLELALKVGEGEGKAKLTAEAKVAQMRDALSTIVSDIEGGDDSTAYPIARAALANKEPNNA